MKTFTVVVVLGLCLSACRDNSVPYVEDPKNVVVDGKAMTHRAFIEEYCIGKPNNETCIKVQNAGSAAAVRSKAGVPRF
jgi:uncharacterized protein YcfL